MFKILRVYEFEAVIYSFRNLINTYGEILSEQVIDIVVSIKGLMIGYIQRDNEEKVSSGKYADLIRECV